jgi:hypothetical protein
VKCSDGDVRAHPYGNSQASLPHPLSCAMPCLAHRQMEIYRRIMFAVTGWAALMCAGFLRPCYPVPVHMLQAKPKVLRFLRRAVGGLEPPTFGLALQRGLPHCHVAFVLIVPDMSCIARKRVLQGSEETVVLPHNLGQCL